MSFQALHTEDGLSLDCIVEEPEEPIGTVVLCHPHPLHGGTMRAPIMMAIAHRLVAVGLRAVRFNFRGVGLSQGVFGDGVDELLDVAAAMNHASSFREPVRGISGWSFGAAVALSWQAKVGSQVLYAGIAPPMESLLSPSLPDPTQLAPATRTFFIGARDQFVAPDDLKAYATSIGASTVVYPGTDHFFVFKHKKLADDVVAALTA